MGQEVTEDTLWNSLTQWDLGTAFIYAFLYFSMGQPATLILWLRGRKQVGWKVIEFPCLALPLLVWLIVGTIASAGPPLMQLRGGIGLGYIGCLLFTGFIGGFILLPRLYHRDETTTAKFRRTLRRSLLISLAPIAGYGLLVLFSYLGILGVGK